MINVAIVDNHSLICDALEVFITNDVNDIEVKSCLHNFDDLFNFLKSNLVHVVIPVLYNIDTTDIENIEKLVQRFSKIKVLVITLYNNEKFVLKLIKAGAKGHLGGDANKSDILEAIYSLRNGYEFYTKTITNFLLNNYLHENSTNAKELEKERRRKNISPREMEVLKLFAEGMSNREIADKLFISIRTVETHKNNIMRKINLKTTVDLVKFAIKNNIIELE
jgi:two-component system response regulator NreC